MNFFKFSAYDWEAINYDPVDGSSVSASNPGRFDAVNIYGDEYQPRFDYSSPPGNAYRGLGTIYRTGYKEKDLVDYNTDNLKVSVFYNAIVMVNAWLTWTPQDTKSFAC